MTTITQRVAAGAAFLDRCLPGWRGKVNAETLAMDAYDLCILGQVFGSYALATTELHIRHEKAIVLGFTTAHGTAQSVALLTVAWRSYLRRPREDGKP